MNTGTEQKKAGRPKTGKIKIKVCLSPDVVAWLSRRATLSFQDRSSLLDALIRDAIKATPETGGAAQ